MIKYKCKTRKSVLETDDSLGMKSEECPECGGINKVPASKSQKKQARELKKTKAPAMSWSRSFLTEVIMPKPPKKKEWFVPPLPSVPKPELAAMSNEDLYNDHLRRKQNSNIATVFTAIGMIIVIMLFIKTFG